MFATASQLANLIRNNDVIRVVGITIGNKTKPFIGQVISVMTVLEAFELQDTIGVINITATFLVLRKNEAVIDILGTAAVGPMINALDDVSCDETELTITFTGESDSVEADRIEVWDLTGLASYYQSLGPCSA